MIKKILVSQPKPSSDKSPYYDIAEKFGVELVFRPFIKVEGMTAKEFRTQKVNILDYTAIVFTSRHAIDHFFTLAKELRVAIPEDMKYFCVTETISLYIQKYVQYRKRKVFFGTTGKIDDLIPTMAKHKQEKYLVPMSDVHNDSVAKMLDAKKLQHQECVMYYVIFAVIIVKMMTIYKCYIIFFRRNVVHLQIILYFCTLEMIPLLAFWGVLVITANYLKINF